MNILQGSAQNQLAFGLTSLKRVPCFFTLSRAKIINVHGIINKINVPQIPPVQVTIAQGFYVRHTMIMAGMLTIADQTPFTHLLFVYTSLKYELFTYIEQEVPNTVVTASQPFLYRQHLHQIVSQSNCENGDGCHIQHRIKLNNRTHNWNVGEVLIETFGVWLAWECSIFTIVRISAQSIPGQLSFNEQKNSPDDV